MRIRTLVVGIAGLISVVALAATSTAQGQDPWAGTWKLNVAKSTYSPGPAPKSSTVTIASVDGGIKQTVDTVPATGAAQHWTVSAKFDGKDAASTGNPNADTQAFTKTDDHHYTIAAKKGGKATTTSQVVISADGKTRTNTQTGVDGQGKPVKNTLVYERQ
jgi:hypothetical protein